MRFSPIAHPFDIASTTDPAVLGERLDIDALREFYRGPGAKYTEVAQHFFKKLANPSFVAAIV